MDNGTLDIQAALRAKHAELSSRRRDLEIQSRMVGEEIDRVNAALGALSSETAIAESLIASEPIASEPIASEPIASEPIAVAKKVVLTGGGPGGFGSHLGDIELKTNHQPSAKKRTQKRRQQKRARG
jgi:hypothetical protein